MRQISFSKALLEATDIKLQEDKRVYVIGLGVPDLKGIFGTTSGLQEKYGSNRIMDMPTSENAMMGVVIGSAIKGMRPIMTHQRVDFFLLGLDQLINNASKWNFMFANQMKVPIVVRLIIGRGWGQGPQHSQSLQSIFAHIPGLKVVMPSNPYDAKGLLIASVEDDHPVVFLEHRWLYNIFGEVPKEKYTVPIGRAKIVKEGKDITLISCSHMTFEAWRAVKYLEKEENISVELVDVRTIKPLDEDLILQSVKKTKKVLILDPDWKFCGFSAEVMSIISENIFNELEIAPQRIAYPDEIVPTSWALSNYYYPTEKDIIAKVLQMFGKKQKSLNIIEKILEEKMKPMDIPDASFKGPF